MDTELHHPTHPNGQDDAVNQGEWGLTGNS